MRMIHESHRVEPTYRAIPATSADTQIRLHDLASPANLLTLARLLMLPALVRALLRPERHREALALLALAMATDAIDGPLARHRGETSALGRVLDPIADKLMLDTTAVALSLTRGFPWPVTALLIARDVAIVLGSLAIYRRHTLVAAARPAGKATTAALTVALLLYLADGPRSGRWALGLAAIPFGLSLVSYGGEYLRQHRAAGE